MHESQHHEGQQHIVGYGTYIFIWLGLLAFTGITVSAAGIKKGKRFFAGARRQFSGNGASKNF